MPTPHFITIALTFKVILNNTTSYYQSINSSNKNIVLTENSYYEKEDGLPPDMHLARATKEGNWHN